MTNLKTILYRTITGTEFEVKLDIEVEYTYIPAEGDGWNEPHYKAHVEIDNVIATFNKQSEDLVLTDKEQEKLNEECMNNHAELSQEDYDREERDI